MIRFRPSFRPSLRVSLGPPLRLPLSIAGCLALGVLAACSGEPGEPAAATATATAPQAASLPDRHDAHARHDDAPATVELAEGEPMQPFGPDYVPPADGTPPDPSTLPAGPETANALPFATR